MTYSLVYTSLPTRPYTPNELLELLNEARAANAKLDVTGLLLYKEDAFIQVLEGERATVTRLADKISRDPRHTAFHVCTTQEIERREFPDWSMGFCDIGAPAALTDKPGYSDFMNQPLTREALDSDPSLTKKLVQLFRN